MVYRRTTGVGEIWLWSQVRGVGYQLVESVVELSKGEVGGLSKVFYQFSLYFY